MKKTILIFVFLFLNIKTFGQTKNSQIKSIVFDHYFKVKDYDISKPTTIHIDIVNDTIWRYVKQDNKQIGDYYRIDLSGKMYYHAKIDKKIMYREYDMFNSKNIYTVTEELNETKLILGYLCHKVVLKEEEFDEESQDTLVSLYEMYVTKEINLPVHSLKTIGKNLSGYFPLEIIISPFGFDDPKEYFYVKSIE